MSIKSHIRQFIEGLMGSHFMSQPHAEQYVDHAEKELLEAIEKDKNTPKKRYRCDLDEQQCRDSCDYPGEREKCPFLHEIT